MKTLLKLAILLVGISALSACSKSSSTATDSAETGSTANATESAVSEVGSASSVSDNGSSPALLSLSLKEETLVNSKFVNPLEGIIHPLSACAYATSRSSCSAGVVTLDWGSCSVGLGAKLTGGWTETYSPDCTAETHLMTAGKSVVRTSAGETLTFLTGATLTADTNGGTAWDGTVINSTGVSITGGATRTIVNDGVHKVLRGPHGRKWFDHFNTANFTVTGSRASLPRVATGTSTTYHNLAHFTGTHYFDGSTPAGASVASAAIQWTDATCCYPTVGTVVTTFSNASGNLSGKSTVMTFTSTCGQASFTDENGTSSTITMNQCR